MSSQLLLSASQIFCLFISCTELHLMAIEKNKLFCKINASLKILSVHVV